MCDKCYNRGKIYQIDGSVTSVKPCNCEVAIEQQKNYEAKADKFRKKIRAAIKESEAIE